ncbi:unnamed protein product [Prorocentrum cordatum]|uniref:NAD(P)-binding domain-containing protein n=1 Tax=Prorocentrum cordatum TaxID=2364126 RepID=A0ABN9YKZ5_9DINO|nr:unnamed protein product [Polarella glacialis]
MSSMLYATSAQLLEVWFDCDVFRNPESIFRFFEPTTGVDRNKDLIDVTLGNKTRWGPGPSPFNLVLTHSGSDFAVCGMHFKIGLYEHQSAGALEGLISGVATGLATRGAGHDAVERIHVVAYEPAYGIIGDPAKKDPKTRQSADHSMAFIVSRMLSKALDLRAVPSSSDEAWKALMLTPHDYGKDALLDERTRSLMARITFEHGGPEFDSRYPDGIPTSIDVFVKGGGKYSSGLVMYPSGHARNTTADLRELLRNKNEVLGGLVFKDAPAYEKFIGPLVRMKELSAEEVQLIYSYAAPDPEPPPRPHMAPAAACCSAQLGPAPTRRHRAAGPLPAQPAQSPSTPAPARAVPRTAARARTALAAALASGTLAARAFAGAPGGQCAVAGRARAPAAAAAEGPPRRREAGIAAAVASWLWPAGGAVAALGGPIVVLGAGGRTGRQCVLAALRRGERVVATTRSGTLPEDLAASCAGGMCEARAVDVTKPETVAPSVAGARGVIFAASQSKGGGTAKAVDNDGLVSVARACIAERVKRLVVVSSGAVSRPDSAVYQFLNLFGGIMAEKISGENRVRALYAGLPVSDVGYTVVRPGGLTEQPARGASAIELSQGDAFSGRISRADVAELCLAAVDSEAARGATVECYDADTAKPLEAVGIFNLPAPDVLHHTSSDGGGARAGAALRGETWEALLAGVLRDQDYRRGTDTLKFYVAYISSSFNMHILSEFSNMTSFPTDMQHMLHTWSSKQRFCIIFVMEDIQLGSKMLSVYDRNSSENVHNDVTKAWRSTASISSSFLTDSANMPNGNGHGGIIFSINISPKPTATATSHEPPSSADFVQALKQALRNGITCEVGGRVCKDTEEYLEKCQPEDPQPEPLIDVEILQAEVTFLRDDKTHDPNTAKLILGANDWQGRGFLLAGPCSEGNAKHHLDPAPAD